MVLLVKVADMGHSETSIVLLISLMTNFINWESGSTICMDFILVDVRTHLFFLLERELFGGCGYHDNDAAADPNLAVFFSSPQVT